ncbi:hypothetical protein AX16_008022 [Volvariella volvacea WC 439]|nr:hypothetical protein AX16_008022 [Volvariella volvacea WC 439]
MDSMLLSHLLAYLKLNDNGIESHPISQMSIFLSLLPGPEADQPPVCGKLPVNDAYKLFARFGNNNFAVHSHLTTYGHGIFPLASRIFNHSCYPNAAAKYVISEARQVTMEIVALREIHTGEEICIPYLDPALTQTRHLILEHSYGFKCGCSSCQLFGGIHQEARPPSDATERLALARNLREFANVDPFENLSLWCRLPSSIPPRLQPAFHEEFLTYLSDTFSEASHEGDYQLALKSGLSIFAFYSMVYPPNYPQIGMHLLELAKTAWNETILHPESSTIQLNEQVRTMLMLANQVLVIYGPEGDEEGPLKEVEVMQRLLSTS